MSLRITFLLLVLSPAIACAQFGDDEIPGTVKLDCGMLIPGLCGNSTTVDPLLKNQRLEVRRIDQIFRQYLVSTRRSEKPVPDAFAMPAVEFDIRQRRVSQRPLNVQIGLHRLQPFDERGLSKVGLRLANGESLEVDVGVTAINSRHVMVTGLNRQWQFGMSIENFSDDLLYPEAPATGLVSQIEGFEKPETRLNVAQMLLEAGRYAASQRLLRDIRRDFPEVASRSERMVEQWNDTVGAQALRELDRLEQTGRFQLARQYARQWPDEKLATVIRVKAKQFLDDQDEAERRLENIRQAVASAVGKIEDVAMRQAAHRVWLAMKSEINRDTLPRFATFELLGQGDDLPPESQFALATTGWLLGADNANDRFEDAMGVFEIRLLLNDYLSTADDEAVFRDECLKLIRETEGFSVERLAQILKRLPPTESESNLAVSDLKAQRLEWSAEETNAVRCVIRLPAEYRPTRRYPLLLAFPRAGLDIADALTWWQQQSDRHGYIVVVPELYSVDAGAYDASAEQQADLLRLIRHLKRRLSVDDDRVFVAGHGIGGEVAMDFGTAHPDLLAGVCSIGGLGRRHLQWTAHNSPELPWYVVIGTRQPNYYARMDLLLQRLFRRVTQDRRLVFCNTLFVRYMDRGFESYAEELPNIFEWMSLQVRPALPDRIKAQVVRSTERDWFWIELDEIPERFTSLDQPNSFESRPENPVSVTASLNRNFINLQQLPSSGAVRLSPDLPDIDLAKQVVIRFGASTNRVGYKPSSRDMLEDFHRRRDHRRLCYMRVPFEK